MKRSDHHVITELADCIVCLRNRVSFGLQLTQMLRYQILLYVIVLESKWFVIPISPEPIVKSHWYL